MKRRQFLRSGLLVSAVAAISPNLLTACRKKEFDTKKKFKGRVIVIGAGASGLYCAQLLKNAGCQVTVLEAGKQVGGRIRKAEGFTDFPVELGAEEIHGEKSLYYRLVQTTGAALNTTDMEDFIYLDNRLQKLAAVAGDSDIVKADVLVDDIEQGIYSSGDQTLEKYISNRYNPRVWGYLGALLANENGTSPDRISLEGLSKGQGLWAAGSTNVTLRGAAHIDILKQACEGVLSDVVLNSPVRKIDYSANTIAVTTASGKTFEADKVVVTVPLTQLQQKSIQFIPALPETKTTAIGKIGMGAGMKVILKFQKRFWPENLGSLYGNGLVPEFWSTGTGRSSQNNCLTAFVHGRNAEKLSALGNSMMLSTMLQELDDMFGPNVASGSFEDAQIMNWTYEPYIQGTYSYPAVNEGDARDILAQPIGNKLFFAGEATHTKGHIATIHGAIETGVRAAAEILDLTS